MQFQVAVERMMAAGLGEKHVLDAADGGSVGRLERTEELDEALQVRIHEHHCREPHGRSFMTDLAGDLQKPRNGLGAFADLDGDVGWLAKIPGYMISHCFAHAESASPVGLPIDLVRDLCRDSLKVCAGLAIGIVLSVVGRRVSFGCRASLRRSSGVHPAERDTSLVLLILKGLDHDKPFDE